MVTKSPVYAEAIGRPVLGEHFPNGTIEGRGNSLLGGGDLGAGSSLTAGASGQRSLSVELGEGHSAARELCLDLAQRPVCHIASPSSFGVGAQQVRNEMSVIEITIIVNRKNDHQSFGACLFLVSGDANRG
jgi:hypothetical protein